MSKKIKQIQKHLRDNNLEGDVASRRIGRRKGYRVYKRRDGVFSLCSLHYSLPTRSGKPSITTIDNYSSKRLAVMAGESLRDAGLLET